MSAFVLGLSHPIQGPHRQPIHSQSKQVEAPAVWNQVPCSTTVASVTVVAGAVSALAGVSRGKRSSAEMGQGCVVVARAFESELGVQAPVGFWDPLGLAADGDVATFTRRRETELKHGRISMLATMGYITPEFFKWPGYLSPGAGLKFSEIPNGLAALGKVPFAGWIQILIYMASVEVSGIQNRGSAPGDFGWKVLSSEDPAELQKKLSAEIANGRLAMMAIIGMFFQDGLTGSAWGDWANYTDSPLRAFENELGVQAPMGFWDPLGLAKDGDAEAFKRRRATEIKHGRVAMIACMGYIAPEFFRWPGLCSPSQKVAFADIPNGLKALSQVPSVGMMQWFLFCGLLEKGVFVQDDSRPAGDFENGGVLGVPNGSTLPQGEGRNRKLNAEIANGRLAMMAIIGMFFQDGLTGEAWGSWESYTDSPLRAFENELGVQEPVGFWDPLGLAADGDMETFKRRRETEIKHGRISMLATMGYITPEVAGKFPGYLSPSGDLAYSDIPNGLGAISKVPALGWGQIVLYCACVEAAGASNRGDAPGEFNWKVLTSSDPVEKQKKLAAEIANGRLAMMAIIGMFFQDGLTGSAWGDWANYTASPLRASPERGAKVARNFFGGAPSSVAPAKPKFDPETQLGVQDPVGFWDPMGFCEEKDEAAFNRRRSIELKHGRVCMLATIGYIVPEYFRFPGFLSPSQNLKFADVPNGLGALSKVPGLGWVQIFFFAGVIEGQWEFSGKKGGPGEFGWKLITSEDPEERKKKLAAEIANGRLSMMAIMGMLFQDGLTGSAWGDWALYTDSPLR